MKNKNISSEIRKTEFWVGLATVVFLVGAGAFVTAQQIKNYRAAHPQQAKTEMVSPAPVVAEKKESMPTPTVTPKLSVIKKLANTSGYLTVYALPNDTFWNISVRMCGTGEYFETIERLNGYSSTFKLQPGDLITVYCY